MLKVKDVRIKVIEPLKKGAITEPWDTALQDIQSQFLRLGKTSPLLEFLTQIVEGEWAIFLQWAYKKKWNRSHKIPRQKGYTNCEQMGDVLLAILNLCIEVHAIHPTDYPNAARWFDAICWEMKYKDLYDLLESSGGKKAYLSYLRKDVIDTYACKENPHNPETEPHIYRLIQACVEINNSGMFPDLIKNYWGTLVKALRTYATHIEKNINTCIENDGKNIYIRRGRERFLVSQELVTIVVGWNP